AAHHRGHPRHPAPQPEHRVPAADGRRLRSARVARLVVHRPGIDGAGGDGAGPGAGRSRRSLGGRAEGQVYARPRVLVEGHRRIRLLRRGPRAARSVQPGALARADGKQAVSGHPRRADRRLTRSPIAGAQIVRASARATLFAAARTSFGTHFGNGTRTVRCLPDAVCSSPTAARRARPISPARATRAGQTRRWASVSLPSIRRSATTSPESETPFSRSKISCPFRCPHQLPRIRSPAMNSERAGTPATRADCITSPCSRTKPRTSRSVIRPASLTFRPVRRLDGAGIETGMTAINEAVRAPVRPSRVQTVAAFLAIYLIWGSTFLAIRVAIESIPPLMT